MEDKKTEDKNVIVERMGKKIIIPEGMSFRDAKRWMERKEQEDETNVRIDEVLDGYPLDAAYAFTKAIARKYGWNAMVPTPGFFGDNPPSLIGLEVGIDQNGDKVMIQVPWGRMQVPNIEGYFQPSVTTKDGRQVFLLGGVVKNKHRAEASAIASEARKILREESIYKGKAIRVKFPEIDSEDGFDARDCPHFIDTRGVKANELVFSKELYDQVCAHVFFQISNPDACRKNGVPDKRGILLEGPYGTGKTMTAYVAAAMCEKHGRTFIYLEDTHDLAPAIFFAQQYQPALIFAEDLDAIMNKGDINDLLNTIDGVATKNSEIMIVLTTNHKDRINQALLRPGRLDMVLHIAPPDHEAAERLVRMYGRNLISTSENLAEVGMVLDGQNPAVIRGIVEDAKLYAMSRIQQQGGDVNNFQIHSIDLIKAEAAKRNHLDLLKPRTEDSRSNREKAAQVLVDGLQQISKSHNGSNGKNIDTPDKQIPLLNP